jgi:hypothetical protein
MSYYFKENRVGYFGRCGVVEKQHIGGLFKNVKMLGAQKTEPRGV